MLRDEWIALAREVIVEILDDQLAVTPREIEARAANNTWPSAGGLRFDPDILTEARRELADEGLIHGTSQPTRGGRAIETWSRSDTKGKSTAVDRAAARKRLLTTRHISWSEGNPRNPKGLIGRAGEDVLHSLLSASDPYTNIQGDSEHVLDTPLVGGSVDAACFITVDSAGHPDAMTAIMEIKNQRQWYYRSNPALHRFLAKAAHLQIANPDSSLVPVFISCWRHNSTFQLARLLGFYAIAYRVQYVLDRAEIDPKLFSEVVTELGYDDLRRGTEPNTSFRHALQISLPRDARAIADRWSEAAHIVAPYSEQIRDSGDQVEQTELVEALVEDVENALGAV